MGFCNDFCRRRWIYLFGFEWRIERQLATWSMQIKAHLVSQIRISWCHGSLNCHVIHATTMQFAVRMMIIHNHTLINVQPSIINVEQTLRTQRLINDLRCTFNSPPSLPTIVFQRCRVFAFIYSVLMNLNSNGVTEMNLWTFAIGTFHICCLCHSLSTENYLWKRRFLRTQHEISNWIEFTNLPLPNAMYTIAAVDVVAVDYQCQTVYVWLTDLRDIYIIKWKLMGCIPIASHGFRNSICAQFWSK